MSSPQPLQQRILAVLELQGSIPAKDMGHWLKDVDAIAIDCALNALLRSSKITRELGRYDLVRAAPRARDRRGESNPVSIAEAVPTAAQEAAASLQPAPAGPTKRRGQRSAGLVNATNQESTQQVNTTSDSPQREGDSRDVSTEHSQQAAAVPETSGSYSRSDPSEDARTPASAESASCVLGATPHLFGNSPFTNDLIFTRVTMRKRAVLNRVALLQAELENLVSEVRDCDRFVELYERFSTNPPGPA